jgi:hypothetical protein
LALIMWRSFWMIVSFRQRKGSEQLQGPSWSWNWPASKTPFKKIAKCMAAKVRVLRINSSKAFCSLCIYSTSCFTTYFRR